MPAWVPLRDSVSMVREAGSLVLYLAPVSKLSKISSGSEYYHLPFGDFSGTRQPVVKGIDSTMMLKDIYFWWFPLINSHVIAYSTACTNMYHIMHLTNILTWLRNDRSTSFSRLINVHLRLRKTEQQREL